MSGLADEQVRIWINACNSEDARETLRELLAYRIGGHAAPLAQRALASALRGALGALEFSRDYHKDLSNEEQAFAQDRLDAAVRALEFHDAGQPL